MAGAGGPARASPSARVSRSAGWQTHKRATNLYQADADLLTLIGKIVEVSNLLYSPWISRV